MNIPARTPASRRSNGGVASAAGTCGPLAMQASDTALGARKEYHATSAHVEAEGGHEK